MKIAIISTFDAGNVKTWSGIPKSIITQLQNDNEVDIIEPPFKRTFLSYFRGIWFNKVRKKQYLSVYDISLLKKNAKNIKNLILKDYDLIISFQFYLLPYINGKKVLITDATFDNLVDYYFNASEISNFTLKQANKLYTECLTSNYACVFSSDWARNSAIKKYNGNPTKLFTIPFGANLAYIPTTEEVSKWIIERANNKVCKLLFLGAFWERKGGLIALEIIKSLLDLNVECRLLIVGCNPEIPNDLKGNVEIIGFLSKENDVENKILKDLLQTSHALLLPSLAECAACVYAEANAYGLPAIGRDTGGVSTIIKDGINGLLMDSEETPIQLAKRWKDIFLDAEKYKDICSKSKYEYEYRLNYSTFYKAFKEVTNL